MHIIYEVEVSVTPYEPDQILIYEYEHVLVCVVGFNVIRFVNSDCQFNLIVKLHTRILVNIVDSTTI